MFPRNVFIVTSTAAVNMATPSKMPRTEDFLIVDGYIHQVSPMKLSAKTNAPYFNCLLQTDRNTFADLVSFSPEKRQLFLQAEEKKTPVKLKNVSRVLSFQSSSGFSIKCSRTTQLDQGQLTFSHKEPPTTQQASVEDTLNTYTVGDYVTLSVKVMHIDEFPETKTTKSGTTIHMKESIVADATKSTNLSIWGNHLQQIQLGKSYILTNVSIRNYNNVKFISTSPRTTVEEIPDIGPVIEIDLEKNTQIKVQGPVELANATISLICSGCKKRLPEVLHTKAATIKCDSCNMRQRLNIENKTVTLKLKLATSDTRFMIHNSVVQDFLKSVGKLSLLIDADDLEEFFFTVNLCIILPNENSNTATKLTMQN